VPCGRLSLQAQSDVIFVCDFQKAKMQPVLGNA
jgi:hypothetical protein